MKKLQLLILVALFFIGSAHAATFTVNSVGDQSDVNQGNGVCNTTALGGDCTLRAAIQEANAFAGTHIIAFAISGAGVKIIAPNSALPAVTSVTTIDGWTQGGAGYTGPPLIEIAGTNAGSTADGLNIARRNVTIRGLAINRFSSGIVLATGSIETAIQGCYIGTNAAGTISLGNTRDGIRITTKSNVIGGSIAAHRNIISGNGNSGIFIIGGSLVFGNVVSGNYIGTNASGTAALGNHTGITISDFTPSNTIGGLTAGERNVISGNTGEGVLIGADFNNIIGNYIGTSASGGSGLGNALSGVAIIGGTNGTDVGGAAAGEGNTIAYNGGRGVRLDSAPGTNGNAIRGNSIFSNDDIGIDLGSNGVSPNDQDDPDGGSNNLQNFPVLTRATDANGITTVQGSLNSTPSTLFTIDFFSSQACDPSGNGEGEIFIGSTRLLTDASGNTTFSSGFDAQVPLGRFITTTATRDTPFETSEFSECVQVVDADSPIVTTTADSGAGSLRQAILDVNDASGFGSITFNIPGAGVVHTINLVSALPTITDPVTVNGASQPGFAGVPLIELNGAGAGETNGLTIATENSTIRSLIINRFDGYGIAINLDGGGNTIRGCYIGTDATGTIDLGNSDDGVFVNSDNNRIGGTAAASRNLISGNNGDGVTLGSKTGNTVSGNYIGTSASGAAALGNSGYGVYVNRGAVGNTVGGATEGGRNVISGNGQGVMLQGDETGSGGNVVIGNYIGTTASGNVALGNSGDGIEVRDSANNRIGGAAVNRRNVISGNIDQLSADGISISGALSAGNAILGNYIGVGADGTTNLGNSHDGIRISAASNNRIGGTAAGDGNVIAYSGDDGIFIFFSAGTATGNSIRGNSIFSNGDLGIDLIGSAGVTPNDPDDPDTGANNLQNYPVITAALPGVSTRVTGTFNSLPSTQFRLEFFNSPTADASGSGEGQFFVGAVNVTTGAGGNANFDQTFAYNSANATFISATATNIATGDTSEFSVAKQAIDPTAGTVSVGGRVTDAAGRGIPGARVLLTAADGSAGETRTNSLGYYRFADVAAGETYIFTVTHKRYEFAAQVVFVGEDASDFNFIALSTGEFNPAK